MIALLLAALCGAAFTDAAGVQAAAQGLSLANQHGSYRVAPWVLYQSRDPLRAVHGRAGVDAVIVETPFERVRYESFLNAIQGTPLDSAAVERAYRDARSSIGFLIYAHSRSDDDRSFLSRFRSARLALAGGNVPDDAEIRFGPSDDFYDVGTFRETRWVGSLTYRFTLNACNERGTLHFTDGYGTHYDLPFDLAKFR